MPRVKKTLDDHDEVDVDALLVDPAAAEEAKRLTTLAFHKRIEGIAAEIIPLDAEAEAAIKAAKTIEELEEAHRAFRRRTAVVVDITDEIDLLFGR